MNFFCVILGRTYKMQIHIRGQNNHVLEVQPTETIGEIKVSIVILTGTCDLAEPQQIKISLSMIFDPPNLCESKFILLFL